MAADSGVASVGIVVATRGGLLVVLKTSIWLVAVLTR